MNKQNLQTTEQVTDFSHRSENNRHSQQILEDNANHINNQCARVLELLKQGHKLTVIDACLLVPPIGDLRRRVKDLRDAGYNIQAELVNKRWKKYYYEGK